MDGPGPGRDQSQRLSWTVSGPDTGGWSTGEANPVELYTGATGPEGIGWTDTKTTDGCTVDERIFLSREEGEGVGTGYSNTLTITSGREGVTRVLQAGVTQTGCGTVAGRKDPRKSRRLVLR